LTIAIISDVHGNVTALQAVLDQIGKLGISQIYNLGDVAGYYPRVNECCTLLRKHNVVSIMGNHDWYLVSGSGCPRSKSANECIDYQRKIITKENLEWISNFKVMHKLDDLIMIHGGLNDPIDEYLKPSETYFAKNTFKYFVSGHTHKQLLKEYDGKVYCNPGSVGQPRDNDSRAAFAVFDGESFELHRVEYDIKPVCEDMQKAGFSEYYYKRLYKGSEHFHN
jgi:putative phosphoesterase